MCCRHIKSYLRSKEEGGNALNRIREVGMESLLKYCALDSLLEWKVAMVQRRQLGLE